MSEGDAPFPSTDQSRERQFGLLIDSVVDYAIFLLDTDGRVASWNRGGERIKGYTADQIIGRHFSVFYTPEDIERDHPRHELEVAAREGRYEEEGWRVRRDGSRFWANIVIAALRDERGELHGYGKVTRDLTARRLNEEQLRGSADLLRAANEQLDQFRRLVAVVREYAIFMLDPGGHIATWNAGAEHIKGYTAEEAIGRHFSMFYTAADRERNHPAYELERAAADGRHEEEGWRVRKDGSRFWANVLITAVRNDHGVLIGFAKVTRDLTDRRATEQSLRASQADLERVNAELDRFAVTAAHDLSEPLRTISGFADLLRLRHGDELGEGAAALLAEMAASAVRMQRLIDDLLAFARAGEVVRPPRPVAVRRAAEQVVADLRATVEDRRGRVTIELPDETLVLADPADVEMVLRNLLSNALKFVRDEDPAVTVAGERVDGSWRIAVADNGIGIAPEHRERIFEAFTRLHPSSEYPGTGLGLAICQRIVERNGGRIGVESTPGAGSRFWIDLPAG